MRAAMPDRGRGGAELECVTQNRSGAAWQRLNGNTIFKRRSRVAGVKPWFRIVRQPKIS
jgi:hypothetical protein